MKIDRPKCPGCGRHDSEVFEAGGGELGSRAVSHIECAERLAGELADCAKTLGGQEYLRETAEAALAKAQADRDNWKTDAESNRTRMLEAEAEHADLETQRNEAATKMDLWAALYNSSRTALAKAEKVVVAARLGACDMSDGCPPYGDTVFCDGCALGPALAEYDAA